VNAFRATLEELHDADLLLHVVDAATPGAPDRVRAVDRILDDLEIDRPRLVVLNKADAGAPDVLRSLAERYDDAVCVSARTGDGLDLPQGSPGARPRGAGPRPAPGRPGRGLRAHAARLTLPPVAVGTMASCACVTCATS
jgi:hypothetical protein